MPRTISLPGSFPRTLDPFGLGTYVAIDFAPSGFLASGIVDRTPGFFAATPLTSQPSSAKGWNILGYSIQLRFAALLSSSSNAVAFARFGNLWAGILINGNIPQAPSPIITPLWPPAEFPSDLSTFTEIWNGQTDPVRALDATISGAKVDTNYDLISLPAMLPIPQSVEPGAQLAFALVMTSSVMTQCLAMAVRSANFSVLYEHSI